MILMLLSNFQIPKGELWSEIALHDRRVTRGEPKCENELALSSAACWLASSADTEFGRCLRSWGAECHLYEDSRQTRYELTS